MYPPSSLVSLLPLPLTLLLSHLVPSTLASSDSKAAPKPCTIHSPSTGSYYDLRPLDLSLQPASKAKDSRTESWHARGYDYPANFTLNFCGPVIEPLKDIDGIPESRWQNISAFYRTDRDKIYSIGQSNSALVFRGRKLLLNYTGGSPCPDLDGDGNPTPLNLDLNLNLDPLDPREIIHDDPKPPSKSPSPSPPPSKINPRQKSTLLSLLCDRDPALSSHPALSFLGTPDHCVYVFEARSRHFCGGTTSSTEPGSLGPGGVFGVILVIALLAYLVGGCAYQRIVMRQRGWRQCPNYAVWAGMGAFAKDLCIILFSTIARIIPFHIPLPSFARAFNSGSSSSRSGGGGYHRIGEDSGGSGRGGSGGVNGSGSVRGGGGRGRRNGVGVEAPAEDEENRLIDQLDEEWDD